MPTKTELIYMIENIYEALWLPKGEVIVSEQINKIKEVDKMMGTQAKSMVEIQLVMIKMACVMNTKKIERDTELINTIQEALVEGGYADGPDCDCDCQVEGGYVDDPDCDCDCPDCEEEPKEQ